MSTIVAPDRNANRPEDLGRAAVKFDAGKARFSLIPIFPQTQLALLYTKGAEKYDDNNWMKGFHFTRTYDAMLRHANLWMAGEDIDPDTGLSHLAAVAWNAFALMEFQHRGTGVDDRTHRTIYAELPALIPSMSLRLPAPVAAAETEPAT